MSTLISSDENCFTLIWKLENVSYCVTKNYNTGNVVSPTFVVNEIFNTKWTLEIYFSNDRNGQVDVYLQRHSEREHAEEVKIDYEVAILSSDGAVLHCWERSSAIVDKDGFVDITNLTPPILYGNEVFFAGRSVFLPNDTITSRCRIWKSEGSMLKDVQCFAHSRAAVEKRSFLWNIENCSSLESNTEQSYEIKSLGSGKELMTLKLHIPDRIICDKRICVKIIPNFENMKISTIKMSVLDASKRSVKCFQDEFWHKDVSDSSQFHVSKELILFYNKEEVLEKRNAYLQNDVLSLWFECVFSCGNVWEEIEVCDQIAIDTLDNHILDIKSPNASNILTEDLKKMLNNSSLSDVKLKTKSKTFPAHTFILGARSPVFNTMFSSNMKEKISECVYIEDLSDDTVLRLLQYIYSGEVDVLDWDSAAQLYEAADKYEILSLKEICSSTLKQILDKSNACNSLILADMHQDKDLKDFVEKFILRDGADIINSEEWQELMGTNLKLAAETMRLRFKM